MGYGRRIPLSQFFVGSSSGGVVPPTVATSYVTDNGTAVPAANTLIINGKDSNINNDNGIIVKGGVSGTGTSNEVDIILTNRITGSVTTTNATPTTLVSLSLGSIPGTYYVAGDLIAYNTTDSIFPDSIGAAYSFSGAATTNGVTAFELGSDEKDIFEDPSMESCDFNIGVTGNSAFIEVIGISGKSINWSCLLTYRYIG